MEMSHCYYNHDGMDDHLLTAENAAARMSVHAGNTYDNLGVNLTVTSYCNTEVNTRWVGGTYAYVTVRGQGSGERSGESASLAVNMTRSVAVDLVRSLIEAGVVRHSDLYTPKGA